MKFGWPIVKLGDICKFENGDRGKNYPGRKAFISSGVPFINAGHLVGGEVDWNNMDYISEDRFKLLSNGKVQNGDVLFCLRGSLGKFAIVEGALKGAIASSLVIIRPSKALDKKFLAAYLASDICSSMIDRFRNGAAQPNLSAKSLGQFEIPLAPLAEQKRIVSLLDSIFQGIDTATDNAENNLLEARKLFETHLQSIFHMRGDGWTEMSLGDAAHIKGGKRVPKGYKLLDKPTPYPYLRVADFGDDGTIDLSNLRYVDQSVKNIIKNYIIETKDLYISIAGTIGRTGIIPEHLEGALLTENACRLVFRPGISNRFVYYFTITADFINQAEVNTRTAAQPKLALSRLATIKLSFPSYERQKEYAEQFDSLRRKTQRLEHIYQEKIAHLTELKKVVLQQAFAGKLTKPPTVDA